MRRVVLGVVFVFMTALALPTAALADGGGSSGSICPQDEEAAANGCHSHYASGGSGSNYGVVYGYIANDAVGVVYQGRGTAGDAFEEGGRGEACLWDFERGEWECHGGGSYGATGATS